ncbi:hypothetical protein BDR07DRAFT_125096 [Suillus spraguei]|nr:hypothetical protein BDR07DRAFT_125096 [Suillus spraguei]
MRIPTSITVLCTLVAYAAAQCMECAPIVRHDRVNYILKEQCTVRSGYIASTEAMTPQETFATVITINQESSKPTSRQSFCPLGSSNFSARCSGCPS